MKNISRKGASRFLVQRPYSNIYHLVFPHPRTLLGDVDMAFHFLRFQEHYEGPAFKGTVFSWAQYVAWYKSVRGSFSYPWDWGGYNIPGHSLKAFRAGAFDPLTRREQAMLRALEGVGDGDYVIGSWRGSAGAMEHELAHAFWHVDAQYKAAVRVILAGGDYAKQYAALAEGSGYDPFVFDDEVQANGASGGRMGPGPERSRAIKAQLALAKERNAIR